MPLFAFVYSHRSHLPVNSIRSFCHEVISLFFVQSFVCFIEPLGSDSNKVDSIRSCSNTQLSSNKKKYHLKQAIAFCTVDNDWTLCLQQDTMYWNPACGRQKKDCHICFLPAFVILTAIHHQESQRVLLPLGSCPRPWPPS